MKTITLTRGQHAIVDDDAHKSLAQFNWHALRQPNTFYAARNVMRGGKRVTIWMHREINCTPAGSVTDHINGDGLDNRRANLRAATHQENMVNCARWKLSSSKYRGVSWHKGNSNWLAQITVDYKNIYIGAYQTEEEARTAYEKKREEVRRGQLIRREAA